MNCLRLGVILLVNLFLWSCGGGSGLSSQSSSTFVVPSTNSFSMKDTGVIVNVVGSGRSYSRYELIDTAQTVNEKMMVLVREEAANDHWVVHLHGGPGGEISAAALNFLDENINEVYFQQRGAAVFPCAR